MQLKALTQYKCVVARKEVRQHGFGFLTLILVCEFSAEHLAVEYLVAAAYQLNRRKLRPGIVFAWRKLYINSAL